MQLASRFASRSPVLRSDYPLSDDQIRAVAPSIFAEAPHESLSERYSYIPTATVLQELHGEGFQPFMVCQTRVRDEGKREHTKHMLRLRHASQINGREANEIILLNSHDGTSSYQMLAGMFRFVCQNGLVCGDTVADVRVPHKGDVAGLVIEGAYEVLHGFDRAQESRDAMQGITLDAGESEVFARAALALKYDDPDKPAPITESQILMPRRIDDRRADLWSVFNRTQENLIKGGLRARAANGRRQSTRPVQGIDNGIRLNRALWLLADGMRQLKACPPPGGVGSPSIHSLVSFSLGVITMNAVTQTETGAIHTAAALEVADPTKNLLFVPLSQLLPRQSKRNVRKTPRMSIPELAASIARVGLLQNLIVILAPDGEHYEVVAGGRRLAALKLLAKKKRIAKDWDVPCLLVADASARTVSLTENVQREAMHPADQFEAFAALVAEGRPIEDIAADFSVTPLVVQRRLKLANVSPRLMTDYRAGAVTLEQLMALAITDDHAAQEAAFYSAPHWQRSPSALREHLAEREIDAQHPLARFVGMDAYTDAGGGTRRDLFAENDSRIYLNDAALLERLVREKLAALAEDVRAEGWAWVEAVPHLSHADRQAFQNAPRQQREPNAREARRLASLQDRLDKTDAALEDAYEAEDEDKAEALHEQRERLAQELHTLQVGLQHYAPDVRAVAGAIVTIDREGEAAIHRGLLREAEAKALRTLEKLRQGFTGTEGADDDAGEDAELPKAANLSDRLAQRLSAHRTAALQIEVARHPQVALAALVHVMVQTVLQEGHYGRDLPLGVSLKVQDRLEGMASDWPESSAAVALRELQQAWGERLPQDSAELFAALLAMEQGELVRLLAVCVAASADVVTPRATPHQPGAELAQAVGLDMRAWWQPTAEGYFNHVPKAVILDAVQQFAPSHVTRLAKLKKTDIASEAERLADGTGWMPTVFKAEDEAAQASTPEEAQDAAPHEAEADAEAEEAETLAA